MAGIGAQDISSTRCSYHVFLSFRGKDTRNSFADHLYTALLHAGIRTFRDDELERGENIVSEITKAIQESNISVIIFSADYASSSWCLDELLIILDRKRTVGHIILPVFYYVDPSEVREQSGSFAKAFAIHQEQFNMETEERKVQGMDEIKRWKEALKEVAYLAGLVLKDGSESNFIQKIIKEIRNKLNRAALIIAPYPIGLSSPIEDINLWLRDGSTNVGITTIFGMSGTGKTTLAKTVYNLNFDRFERSSILLNIRETAAQPNGMIGLQERLLSDILKKTKQKIRSCEEGIIKIKDAIRFKRVLIVFDDVDTLDRYNAIQKARDWFYPGSKIIITTRNSQLLKTGELYNQHKVENLALKDLGYSLFGESQKDTQLVAESENIEALAIEPDEFSGQQGEERAVKNIVMATKSGKTGNASFPTTNGRGREGGVFKRGYTKSLRVKSRLRSHSRSKPFADVNEHSDRSGVAGRHSKSFKGNIISQSKYEGITENPVVHNMVRDQRCKVVENNGFGGKSKMVLEFLEPERRGFRPLVDPDVAEEGSADWRNCFVGYFIDTPRRLSYEAVNTIAHGLWNTNGLIEVLDNERGFFFFRFSTEQESEAILERGPWHFADCHIVLEKWRKGMNFLNDKMEKIPIWVKFHNVPLEFWNAKGLSYIASAVGKPLYAGALTESRTRLGFAHICVEIEAGIDLVEEFDIRINDSVLIPIKVEYEWKPLSCTKCKEFGHSTHACSINFTMVQNNGFIFPLSFSLSLFLFFLFLFLFFVIRNGQYKLIIEKGFG
ncbi:putative disease resistance protein At4g11170 isoform X2 [Cornus florida]|nr:putative disease resistance protein At4g11170 isoform X2 [Cornus florida]